MSDKQKLTVKRGPKPGGRVGDQRAPRVTKADIIEVCKTKQIPYKPTMTALKLRSLCIQEIGVPAYQAAVVQKAKRRVGRPKGTTGTLSAPRTGKSIKQLRALCKRHGVKGYSTMNKAQLINVCEREGYTLPIGPSLARPTGMRGRPRI